MRPGRTSAEQGSRGRPKVFSAQGPQAAGGSTAVQAKSQGAGRIVAYALLAFCLLGALAGLLSWVRPHTVEAAPVQQGSDEVELEQEAFAADYLAAWMDATRDDAEALSRYVPVGPQDIEAEEPIEHRDIRVASSSPHDDLGGRTVVLSASVRQPVEEQAQGDDQGDEQDGDQQDRDQQDEQRREAWVPQYFQVVVAQREDGLAAVGLPTPIQQPGIAQPPALDYPVQVNDDQIEATVGDFLSAYAAGDGDVTRYIAPDSGITSISPAPYRSMQVDEITATEDIGGDQLSDDTQTPVLATAHAETSTGSRAVQYALTLTVRDGRWEIASIDPAPRVRTGE